MKAKKPKKKEPIAIERIAILAKLSDGTIRQVLITDGEQGIWLGVLSNFYNPIKIFDTKLDAIEF